MEEYNYQFDVIPITVLGTGSDNDPANFDIANRVKILEKEWKKFGVVEVKMVTLNQFFEEVRYEKGIPTYSGEWPDWWTNGVASEPKGLRAFREPQRIYKKINRLGHIELNISDDLLLYSEHTYGTEDSIREAHSQYNFNVESIKNLYAFSSLKKHLI